MDETQDQQTVVPSATLDNNSTVSPQEIKSPSKNKNSVSTKSKEDVRSNVETITKSISNVKSKRILETVDKQELFKKHKDEVSTMNVYSTSEKNSETDNLIQEKKKENRDIEVAFFRFINLKEINFRSVIEAISVNKIIIDVENSYLEDRFGVIVVATQNKKDISLIPKCKNVTDLFGIPKIGKLSELDDIQLVYVSGIDVQVKTEVVIEDANLITAPYEIFSALRTIPANPRSDHSLKIYINSKGAQKLRERGYFLYNQNLHVAMILSGITNVNDSNLIKVKCKNIPSGCTNALLKSLIQKLQPKIDVKVAIVKRDFKTNKPKRSGTIIIERKWLKALSETLEVIEGKVLTFQEEIYERKNTNND